MQRTLEQVNQEYTSAAAILGQKEYHISIKTEEVQKLTEDKQKALDLMRTLSQEAYAIQQAPPVAQDAVEVTNETV